jgi:hypothetical protein
MSALRICLSLSIVLIGACSGPGLSSDPGHPGVKLETSWSLRPRSRLTMEAFCPLRCVQCFRA